MGRGRRVESRSGEDAVLRADDGGDDNVRVVMCRGNENIYIS